MKWVNANGKALPGLWRRRLAEALLFMGIKEIPTKYDNDYANMKYFPADWNLEGNDFKITLTDIYSFDVLKDIQYFEIKKLFGIR